jgi:hypothetical protein
MKPTAHCGVISVSLPRHPAVAYLFLVRRMVQSARITLTSSDAAARFEWLDFDGDDCFGDFHVIATSASGDRRFDFGPCAVWGLRRLSRFLRDPAQPSVVLGFRHPDIRHCELFRSTDTYRLVVHFEGSSLHEEFCFEQPEIDVADEFLAAYDT